MRMRTGFRARRTRMRKGTCLGGKRMAAQRQCKVLNVAEKNDAARELSKVMSRGRFNRVRLSEQLKLRR